MANYLEDLFGLKGMNAVVIGGTGVLGGAIATCLARAGARVAVVGRSEERGEQRVQEIRTLGGEAQFLKGDVSSRADIEAIHSSAMQAFKRVDILVNGAGVNSAQPFFDIDDETWNRLLTTNLTAIHWACQVFGKTMLEAGSGSVINIASVSSDRPLSRVFAYSASKSAVVNYTQNVAREWGDKGIRVNCLSPGFFPAEQNRKILDAERIENVMRRTPMKRFGEPSDLDGAVLLLASNAGRFITGANYFVDGGFTAMSI